MIKFKKLLATVIVVITVFPLMADDTPITPPVIGGSGDLTLIKKKEPTPPPSDPYKPKKTGIQQYLHASYENDILTIEFPSDAESGVVTIGTGDFVFFSASIDRMDNTVELPQLSGEFLLTVTFDNGDVYEGEISF